MQVEERRAVELLELQARTASQLFVNAPQRRTDVVDERRVGVQIFQGESEVVPVSVAPEGFGEAVSGSTFPTQSRFNAVTICSHCFSKLNRQPMISRREGGSSPSSGTTSDSSAAT
jgi:hypothetical protein